MSQTRFLSDAPPARVEPSPFVCSWSGWGPDAGWVHAAGELDLAASARLARTLEEALHHARLVVLDLRELTFMDSAGLHAIIDAGVRARHERHRLMLVRGPAQVLRLFALTGTGQDVEILDLDPDEQPAYLDEEAVIGADSSCRSPEGITLHVG